MGKKMGEKQSGASVLANRDLEKKYNLPDSKNGKHVMSAYERLRNRIYREVKRKKLIGDIPINDEEFAILIEYLQSFYRYLALLRWEECTDLLVCVAMVQIGIRYYDGGYWTHFAKLLDKSNWNVNRQAVMGKICIATLHKYDKFVNDENERINTVLMHGFVADKYFDDLVDFLFAYYRIDLERDLSRNDRDTMRDLLDSMKRKDSSNRTYKLVQQTSDAVTANPIGSNIRLRWLLRLIDASFWGEEIKINRDNRLSRLFGEWMNKSKEFSLSRGARGEKQRIFSSPHLMFDSNKEKFELQLPAQIVRNREDLFWTISMEGKSETLSVEAFEVVLGYKTEPLVLPIAVTDIFSRMTFALNYRESSKKFYLPKEDVRFFTKDGYSVAYTSLKAGEYYAFSPTDVSVESTALIESNTFSGLKYYYFSFEDGDLLRLPNGTAICIGKHVEEGLIGHGILKGATSLEGNAVFTAVPSVLIKLKESALSGTAITINGVKHRLPDRCVPVFVDLEEGKPEKGCWFSLESLGCNQDGDYEIDVDVPNDRSVRRWKFTLIKNLGYQFVQTPYIFSTKGSIVFQSVGTSIVGLTPGVEYSKDDNTFNFAISSENRYLDFSVEGILLRIFVPMLEYSFDNSTWNTLKHDAIWHADFPVKIWIRYPSAKIKFEMVGQDYGEEETAEVFTKRTYDDIFECDLTRFKSWINNERMRNTVLLHCGGETVSFLDIVARSYVVSAIIEADAENNKLLPKCDIIGRNEYYVDIYCNNKLIAEKILLQNGQAEIEGRIRSGEYHMEVFEAEQDEDVWFDDIAYKSIYKTNPDEVVNPHDLTGKNLEILSVMMSEKDLFKLQFDRKYHVTNLELIDESDECRYSGVLMDVATSRIVADNVVVEFFNINQLRYVTILWIDPEYGDECEFLYDFTLKQLVCEECPGLSKSEKYRRYEPLYTDDYFFGVTLINRRKQIHK